VSDTALRPDTWEGFIGQEELKRRLRIRIDAANRQYRYIDHILLMGPPGIGKTTLASLIAKENKADFLSFICPFPIAKLRETTMSFHGAIMLDEIHRYKAKDQEELLPFIEDGYWQRHWGQERPFTPTLIIAATTEFKDVIPPLRERFYVPPFEEYTDEEMGRIVTNMGRMLHIEFSEETAIALGRASVGTPRQARHIVKCAADLSDPNDIEAVLDLAGVTEDGLSIHHIRYMQCLRRQSSGIAGLKVLASTIGLPESEVSNLEFVLRKRDFIENTPRGRSLKGNGYKFLNDLDKQQQEVTSS
jgi:holliday junction DNA helicase RuvB